MMKKKKKRLEKHNQTASEGQVSNLDFDVVLQLRVQEVERDGFVKFDGLQRIRL